MLILRLQCYSAASFFCIASNIRFAIAIESNGGTALPISNLQLSQNSIEQEYLNYKEELDSFDSHAHYLSNENLEKLILFINRKSKTYAELKAEVSILNDATLQLYLSNTPKKKVEPPFYSIDRISAISNTTSLIHSYFKLVTIPKDFFAPYYFDDSDEFQLTVSGLNFLHQLEKENHALQLAEESLRISKESAKYGKFAAWLAGIGIFTTIIIAILTFIFS